ncbi:DnaA regulatory inactivator Hda [Candidatus Spongiihabitans sp.]|uniref:DnaA regulatory inactivator Hda n=1 Tax=Candidatus Spongiihabitans sp. TaxID=3101308 RepID=UPI003C7B6742
MNRQTVIPIGIEDDASLECFYSKRNQPLIEQLKNLLAGARAKRVLYLWGESGSGKTHLLNACCRAAGKSGRQNLYVSLKQHGGQHGGRLEQLSDVHKDTLVCIDDLQQIVGCAPGQNQIFSLYEKIMNGAGMNGAGAIVVSGTSPLGSIGITLKDLESRLSSGGVFNIYALDDDEKRTALKLTATKRGFALDDGVVQFIMSHYQRDTKSLFALLDKLDRGSLQAHRKITIPFVKTLM